MVVYGDIARGTIDFYMAKKWQEGTTTVQIDCRREEILQQQ